MDFVTIDFEEPFQLETGKPDDHNVWKSFIESKKSKLYFE